MGDFKKLDKAALLEAAKAGPPPLSPSTEPVRANPFGLPASRVGNSFKSWSETPAMKEAFNQCWGVAKGVFWCAFLIGLPGNGKTHLAAAALQEHGTGRFWKVPELLVYLRKNLGREMAGNHENTFDTEEMIKNYASGDWLLVLDDLGTENPTDWASEQLYRILDGRYEARVPTIVTTNVDDSRIDQRIWSRYREGLCLCRGKDMRP